MEKFFEKLSNYQQQLLISFGIRSDSDMPPEFFEKIRPVVEDLSR